MPTSVYPDSSFRSLDVLRMPDGRIRLRVRWGSQVESHDAEQNVGVRSNSSPKTMLPPGIVNRKITKLRQSKATVSADGSTTSMNAYCRVVTDRTRSSIIQGVDRTPILILHHKREAEDGARLAGPALKRQRHVGRRVSAPYRAPRQLLRAQEAMHAKAIRDNIVI
jgi:hypothetical protein